MGISGLTTFMNANPHLLKNICLHNSIVVIDGNSLYHLIFYNNHVDFLHGGDYDHYAREIKEFFTRLHSCKIRPYLVFDGGYEQDDRKLSTILERKKQRLEMVIDLANGHQRNKVMPILAYETFRTVLLEINVPFVVCDFEADKEVAILANKFNCPVLSNDSDFYILSLDAGFIPFDNVNFTLVEGTIEDGTVYHYLPARRYHVDNFVKFFPSLGKAVLSLLATLLGNDYVDFRMFQAFYSSVYEGKTQFRIPKLHTKMLKVISWLESLKSYNKGIEKIMGTAVNPTQRKTISLAIRTTIDAFTTDKSDSDFSLYSYFQDSHNAETYSRDCELPPSRNLVRGYNGSSLPNWFLPKHRQGLIPQIFIDIITLHRTFIPQQVEHPKSQSSHQCSFKLRQLLYGILLSEDIATEGKKDKLPANRIYAVEEYDRQGSCLQKELVCPAATLKGYGQLPRLTEIPGISHTDKKNLLCKALDIPLFTIEEMTGELELVLGIILYWKKNAQPKVTLNHLRAMVVCLIMLKVKWVHHGATGCGRNMIEATVLHTSIETVKEVRTKLHPYNVKPDHNKKHPVDSELIHGFAQFQSCILVVLHLNYLLQCPFPSPYIPHIFSGTFLYNFCQELEKRRSPDMFIHEMLAKNSKLPVVYQNLFDTIKNYLPSDDSKNKKRSNTDNGVASSSNYSESKVLSSKGKRKTKSDVQYVGNCRLTNRFDLLYSRDDSQSESDE